MITIAIVLLVVAMTSPYSFCCVQVFCYKLVHLAVQGMPINDHVWPAKPPRMRRGYARLYQNH